MDPNPMMFLKKEKFKKKEKKKKKRKEKKRNLDPELIFTEERGVEAAERMPSASQRNIQSYQEPGESLQHILLTVPYREELTLLTH
jgi:hypothetical protein